jgi:hypothetical protein
MAAKDLQNPGIALGFDMADHALVRIAHRAIELQDPVLLEELKAIDYVQEG